MKKFLAILLCLAILCGFAVPVSAASPTKITLTPDKTTVAKGEKVTFTVSVQGDNLYTYLKVTVNYDTDLFKIGSRKNLLPDRWFGSNTTNVFAYADQYREAMKNDYEPEMFYDYAYVGNAFSFTLEAKVDCPDVSEVSITPVITHNDVPVSCTTNSVDVTVTGQHSWSTWTNGGENGHTRTCSKCSTPETAAHTWDKGKETKAATCKEAGVKTFTCTTTGCGATKTEPIAKLTTHNWGDWTKVDNDQHKRTCSTCGDSVAETDEHKWDDGKITKPATCATPGEKTYTCSVCKGTKVVPTDPDEGHTWGKWQNLNETEHKATCTVCQTATKTNKHKWNDGTVSKAATCKEYGVRTKTCTECGATKTESIPKLTEHDWGTWVKESDTKHKHTCKVCGDTVFESKDHDWNAGTVTKVATCKEDGVRTFTCTGCGAEKTESIPKLTEHAWGKWQNLDADNHKRTCTVCGEGVFETAKHGFAEKWTSDGTQHWHACADCDAKKDAANHTPGAAATETTAQRCTVCSRILKAALGHTHKWDTKYTTDAESHWYACSGCNEKKDAKAHDFANDCDGLCETCQYTRETTHKFGTEWTSDATGHWHACTSCGEKADVAEHAPGMEATETNAQTCTACGFELAPALGHTHVFSETWEKDGEKHWHVCACGEKSDEAAHEWNDQGNCPTCLAEKPAEPEKDSFPWLIVLLGVVAIGAAAVLVIVSKKKKN